MKPNTTTTEREPIKKLSRVMIVDKDPQYYGDLQGTSYLERYAAMGIEPVFVPFNAGADVIVQYAMDPKNTIRGVLLGNDETSYGFELAKALGEASGHSLPVVLQESNPTALTQKMATFHAVAKESGDVKGLYRRNELFQ